MIEQDKDNLAKIPPEYRRHDKVFSEQASQRLPKHSAWDHKIELLLDAPEEPLDYPVETPAIPGGRWAKINHLVNEMTEEEYEAARAGILEQDFQTA